MGLPNCDAVPSARSRTPTFRPSSADRQPQQSSGVEFGSPCQNSPDPSFACAPRRRAQRKAIFRNLCDFRFTTLGSGDTISRRASYTSRWSMRSPNVADLSPMRFSTRAVPRAVERLSSAPASARILPARVAVRACSSFNARA